MTEYEKRILEAAVQDLTRVYNRVSHGANKAVLNCTVRNLQDILNKRNNKDEQHP